MHPNPQNLQKLFPKGINIKIQLHMPNVSESKLYKVLILFTRVQLYDWELILQLLEMVELMIMVSPMVMAQFVMTLMTLKALILQMLMELKQLSV